MPIIIVKPTKYNPDNNTRSANMPGSIKDVFAKIINSTFCYGIISIQMQNSLQSNALPCSIVFLCKIVSAFTGEGV